MSETHTRLADLFLFKVWELFGGRPSAWEKGAVKAVQFCWKKQSQSCPGASDTTEAPGSRERPGGLNAREPDGSPVHHSLATWGKPQSECQFLPWSNESVYDSNITSVVVRNK